jgi:hypothetical protein
MSAPLYDAERGTLSMALVGDAMIARALSPHQEPAFLALAEVLQSPVQAYTRQLLSAAG